MWRTVTCINFENDSQIIRIQTDLSADRLVNTDLEAYSSENPSNLCHPCAIIELLIRVSGQSIIFSRISNQIHPSH